MKTLRYQSPQSSLKQDPVVILENDELETTFIKGPLKGQPKTLIIIPAYNEEERIGPVLRDYADYFRENYAGEFRAVVVLNGCRDDTLGVVKKIAEEFPEIVPLNFDEPIGKAVR